MSGATSSPMGEHAIETARVLVTEVNARGGVARLLGGVAVALRCPTAQPRAPLARPYSDIDLVTSRKASEVLGPALQAHGYAPEERFNALHGRTRMRFQHPDGAHVDVFVEEFNMCHRLELGRRLTVHDTTLSLADLLLTKLQVADLNEKDVTDTAALLLDHDLSDDETGISVPYITRILGADWGWWRTVSHNLRLLPTHLDRHVLGFGSERVAGAAQELLQAVDTAPKGLRWKVRAKAGDRIPWREDPEESR
jgi:hypothetical protein